MRRIRLSERRAPHPIRVWRIAVFAFILSSCNVLSAARPYYTPAVAYDRADTLSGTTVTVRGRIEVVASSCTLEACPPGDPCCNGCYHQLGFRADSHHGILLSGNDSGCTGNPCTSACPFIDPLKRYEVTGTLAGHPGYFLALEMESWRMVD